MSIYDEIYALLNSTGITIPVSPVEQQEEVRPPSVIFEPVTNQQQAKRRPGADEVDLLLLFYAVSLSESSQHAETMKAALNYTNNTDFDSIRFQEESVVWREPNYIVMQRYRLKKK